MVFEGLAEKYENFIAMLEEKGVPNPRILVPLAAILVIALVVFLLATPGLFAQGKTVKVYVKSAADNSFVSNVGVTLYAGDQSFVAKTNSDGIAEFKGVPDKSLSVTVSASGFQKIINQPLPSDNTVSLSPESNLPASKTISVRVKDAEGNDVSGANVVITFDDGTMKTSSTDSFGIAEVSVPIVEAPTHAKVSVEADGFEKKDRSVTQTEFDSTIFIELIAVAETPTEETEGVVRVSVLDEEYNPVSTALVSLIDYYTDAVLRSAKTEEDGSAAFDKITVGKKFRVSVKHEKYEAFASEEVYTLEIDSPTVSITLTKKTIPDPNALKIDVVDEQNNPVGGATITVYDRSTKTMLAIETADYSKGEASFSVPKGKSLYVTAYADGFLPGFDELAQAGQTKKIVLVKETAGNYFDIAVTTLQEGEPAPNALVTLYNANGFPLGVSPAYTGADGIITMRVPAKVKNAEYALFAAASLDTLKGKSDVGTPNDDLVLTIALQPEPASLKVYALDVSTNEAIQNAAVGLTSGGALITTCTTDDKGACEFAIAPNT
ncbi:hypothetical protein H0N96_01635, partial [Candidatus Micrarchaeota archaeon]|nr:hypothetical protein [Candidatus Micrarchaeota archaeon]